MVLIVIDQMLKIFPLCHELVGQLLHGSHLFLADGGLFASLLLQGQLVDGLLLLQVQL